MARRSLPIRATDADQVDPDQVTTYQASRGGWYPPEPTPPVPGAGSDGRVREGAAG
ncbi:hypothetical protein [Streptomyces sp. DW26H14]|uniref:hypothetical protein n=1 Tax=Streptomyces sp. DW26H14 TaxID=3435395 RepID=UPI00403D9294